jgi:hypothetical protein
MGLCSEARLHSCMRENLQLQIQGLCGQSSKSIRSMAFTQVQQV